MGKRMSLADLAEDDLDFATQRPSRADAPTARVEQSPPREVPVGTVSLNPLNKRPPEGDEELDELAETIRTHGLLQPLVVCSAEAYLGQFPEQRGSILGSQWVALIGNRRLRAARAAEVATVPIVVNDGQATSMYEVMLVENVQRRDLPPLLEAEAMTEVMRRERISQREVARRIGKSAMYITHRLALLKLIPALREAFERGELKIELARTVGELPEREQRAIVAAGAPYRPLRPEGSEAASRARSIRVSSPASAAESIGRTFSRDELVELLRLLTEQLDAEAG